MSTQSKKRGTSNPPKTQATATSSSSRTESSSTSQTVYERQEVETRTLRTPPGVGGSTAEAMVTGSMSSLSPLSRAQEKQELKLLNNRLAAYIDKIRSLEDEIVVLRRKVETYNSTESQEAKTLEAKYGREIANLRRALDEISKDLAAATAERDELRTERKDYLAKNNSLENDKKALQKKLKDAEAALKDARAELSGLKDDVREQYQLLEAANLKNRELQAQLDASKKDLQGETLRRVEAENKLLTAREELKFQKELHDEQITTLRNQRVVEVTEVETRLRDDYHANTAEQLDMLRQDMEILANETRQELEQSYQQQIEDLQNLADRNAADAQHVLVELRSTQTRIKEIQGKSDRQVEELRGAVIKLERMVASKDGDIQRLQQLLAERQKELQETHFQLNEQIRMYQELLDEKIQLDAELATYNALLRTEESRLSMTSPPFPSTPDSARRGAKRRLDQSGRVSRTRFRNEATAKGAVHIVEIDDAGQYVRLENKSAEDILIGGWTLHMKSDNGTDNETRYKIHAHQVLKAHSTMTIWSANTNVVHDPPLDIVMDGRWLVGDNTRVTLYNSEEEEVARREMARSASAESSSFIGSSGVKRRRLVNRDSEVVDGAEQKNCIIM